ncbi:MAG TPA: sterol desaturase family protein [Candidatus Binatia bacterium]|nr:sterol desaturase family protein [Candidatus Binatia bacterium]
MSRAVTADTDFSVDAAALSAPESPRTLAEAARVFVRHGSPRFLLTANAIVLTARAVAGGFSVWDLALCATIFALWPVQEWLIHVFILHYEPVRIGRWTLDFRVPIKHRAHHRDPWNLEILFIPVQGFFLSLPLLLLIFAGLMPTLGLALTGLSFYMLMSLRYEWVHFLVHTRYRPKSEYFKRLWRNHRLHHCKNEHYWFGVTMTGGDLLLRTSPDPTTVPLSATVRTLGIESDSPLE